MTDQPDIPTIDRHAGEPLVRLHEVRRDHNLVGAYEDVEAARAAILVLEQSGVTPRTISLLGAWPADGHTASTPGPRLIAGRSVLGAVAGAIVLGALGAVVAATFDLGVNVSVAAIGGAIFGALLGFPLGLVRATGMSDAWQDTFAADGSGTVAVGVHSDDETEVDDAEHAMTTTQPLAMNRF